MLIPVELLTNMPKAQKSPTKPRDIAPTNPFPLLQYLYILASVTTGLGTVFAWTFLRAVNGALAIRADKLIGPENTKGSIALNDSRNENQTEEMKKTYETTCLVTKWIRYNQVRAVILVVGTVVGACALALDERW